MIRFATFKPGSSKATTAESPDTLLASSSPIELLVASNQDGSEHNQLKERAGDIDNSAAGCGSKIPVVAGDENECTYCGVPGSAHSSAYCPYK